MASRGSEKEGQQKEDSIDGLLKRAPVTEPEGACVSSKLGGGSAKWQRVVSEIINSEEAYVKSLGDVMEGYVSKIDLYLAAIGINQDDTTALFGNIKEIHQFNSDLLVELRRCSGNPVETCRCFLKRMDGFERYSTYCTTYPQSVSVLQKINAHKGGAEFLKGCQDRLKQSLPLGSELIKPVQRILKYHLLMRELHNHCGRSLEGDDLALIKAALDGMQTVAARINEMKREHEKAVYVQEVQASLEDWKGDDLSSYGELLLESELLQHRKWRQSNRRVFLFEKIFLVVKPDGGRLVYRGAINTSRLALTDNKNERTMFAVTNMSDHSSKFIFVTANETEKKRWTDAIRELVIPKNLSHNARRVLMGTAESATFGSCSAAEFEDLPPLAKRPSLESVIGAGESTSEEHTFPRPTTPGSLASMDMFLGPESATLSEPDEDEESGDLIEEDDEHEGCILPTPNTEEQGGADPIKPAQPIEGADRNMSIQEPAGDTSSRIEVSAKEREQDASLFATSATNVEDLQTNRSVTGHAEETVESSLTPQPSEVQEERKEVAESTVREAVVQDVSSKLKVDYAKPTTPEDGPGQGTLNIQPPGKVTSMEGMPENEPAERMALPYGNSSESSKKQEALLSDVSTIAEGAAADEGEEENTSSSLDDLSNKRTTLTSKVAAIHTPVDREVPIKSEVQNDDTVTDDHVAVGPSWTVMEAFTMVSVFSLSTAAYYFSPSVPAQALLFSSAVGLGVFGFLHRRQRHMKTKTD